MQYNVATPQDYLDALDADWRRDRLQTLRGIILDRAPALEEVISHKMLGYRDKRGVAFHLNAQKGYVSLYVGDIAKIDTDGALLKGIDCGKSCARFKKSNPIDTAKITALVDRAVDLWRQGADTGC
ncbi:MAG: DUF1801 domain-containing protein [Pseudomonadota bacterium]